MVNLLWRNGKKSLVFYCGWQFLVTLLPSTATVSMLTPPLWCNISDVFLVPLQCWHRRFLMKNKLNKYYYPSSLASLSLFFNYSFIDHCSGGHRNLWEIFIVFDKRFILDNWKNKWSSAVPAEITPLKVWDQLVTLSLSVKWNCWLYLIYF